jgi:hypothetical protein
VKLARFRRPKAESFFLYVEYMPKTNKQYYEKQVMLWGGHIQVEEGKRRKFRR